MTSKAETLCREFAEKIMGVKFNKCRPNILKNPETGSNLELDMYNESLRIAIEYNGKQHYKYPSFFIKTEEAFMQQLRRDDYKKKMCKYVGIKLITVPYTVKAKDMEKYLYDRLMSQRI